MSTLKDFTDLEIWQLARQFNKDLSSFLQLLQEKRAYELGKQLDRSAGSILDNIAEGFARGGTKELVQFLYISKASCSEARSQLIRAYDRQLISQNDFDKYCKDCLLIADKTGRFINYLRHSGMKGEKYV